MILSFTQAMEFQCPCQTSIRDTRIQRLSGETEMNRFDSYRSQKNYRIRDGFPPQGLFRGTAGSGVVFLEFFSCQSAAGGPFGGGCTHHNREGETIPDPI